MNFHDPAFVPKERFLFSISETWVQLSDSFSVIDHTIGSGTDRSSEEARGCSPAGPECWAMKDRLSSRGLKDSSFSHLGPTLIPIMQNVASRQQTRTEILKGTIPTLRSGKSAWPRRRHESLCPKVAVPPRTVGHGNTFNSDGFAGHAATSVSVDKVR